jgi:hypothetical protein
MKKKNIMNAAVCRNNEKVCNFAFILAFTHLRPLLGRRFLFVWLRVLLFVSLCRPFRRRFYSVYWGAAGFSGRYFDL